MNERNNKIIKNLLGGIKVYRKLYAKDDGCTHTHTYVHTFILLYSVSVK